jgi:hypothetical protein
VQEEFRENTIDGSSSKHDDDEDCSLIAKARKGKWKKFHPKSESKVKNLDLSKVKCFHYHENGHLTTNCPQKRKNKMVVGSTTGEALVSQFDLEFSLIACMASSALGSMWYLDSGASFHHSGPTHHVDSRHIFTFSNGLCMRYLSHSNHILKQLKSQRVN